MVVVYMQNLYEMDIWNAPHFTILYAPSKNNQFDNIYWCGRIDARFLDE